MQHVEHVSNFLAHAYLGFRVKIDLGYARDLARAQAGAARLGGEHDAGDAARVL